MGAKVCSETLYGFYKWWENARSGNSPENRVGATSYTGLCYNLRRYIMHVNRLPRAALDVVQDEMEAQWMNEGFSRN